MRHLSMAALLLSTSITLTCHPAHSEWLEADLMLSEYWARSADEWAKKGKRDDAVADALKGIPAGIGADDLGIFHLAHDALYRALRSENFTLPLGQRQPSLMTLSGDRTRAVTDSRMPDGSLVTDLWDVEKGEVVAVLARDNEGVNFDQANFSPDTRYVVIGETDGYFSVFDAGTGATLGRRRATETPGGVLAIDNILVSTRFSPSSSRLVTVGIHPAKIRVWSLPDLAMEMEVTDFEAAFIASPDFKQLFAHFADDETLCVAVKPTDVRFFNGVTVGFIEIARGTFDPFYTSDEKMGKAMLLQGIVECSPDKKWAIMRFGDVNYIPHTDVIDVAAGKRYQRYPQLMNYVAVYNDDVTRAALFSGEGWVYLDLATSEISSSLAGAPESFRPFSPVLLDEDTGQEAAIDMSHYARAGTQGIWRQLPAGTAMIEMAFELLPPELQQAVEAERID